MRGWLLALLVGCGFQHGAVQATGDGSPPDVAANDTSVPGDAPRCFGSAGSVVGQICLMAPPEMPVALTMPIDTGPASMQCASGATPTTYCVVAGTAISVAQGVTVGAHGPRPLVLVSSSTIVVMGTIDVASHMSGTPQPTGAGAGTGCTGTTPATGGGGGFGGTFGTSGGDGGGSMNPNGNGGRVAMPATVATLVGGCTGGKGAGSKGGTGGAGGGAVALIAVTSIEIDGTINASGAGALTASGFTPNTIYGGGGGGAGGMIVLDAPMLSGAGTIMANGGGGAQASDYTGVGGSGNDPSSATAAAAGGYDNTQPYGGRGGDGAFGSTAATAGHDNTAGSWGGGGGGGGVGVVKVYSGSSAPGTVSPPAS